MSTGKVLVVIPARNEAHTIGGVINKTRSLYPDYDIVVVDDASEDDTGTIARSQGALVLRTPIRLGYGGAVQTGFKYAASRDYEVVVLMDADGQHDPACIGDLVKATERFDLVIGSRFRGELLYKIPAVRLIGMKIFSWIVTNIVGHRITDTSSGFQAMRKDVFSLFASGAYPVDFPDADTIIWVARHGLKVGEVPVRMHPRKEGRSMISGIGASVRYALKMPLSILVTLLRIPGRTRG